MAAAAGTPSSSLPSAAVVRPWDVICGSDLIYYTYSQATPHSRLLLAALKQLAGPETMIVLSLSLHHNPEEVSDVGLLGSAGIFERSSWRIRQAGSAAGELGRQGGWSFRGCIQHLGLREKLLHGNTSFIAGVHVAV